MYVVGNAVVRAATRLRSLICSEVVERLGGDLDASAIEIGDGIAHLGGSPDPSVRLCELGCIRAEGTFAAPDSGMVAGAQFAAVVVDTHTGQVTVEHVWSLHDVGRLIHPAGALGQVYGGIVQGLGLALTERSHDEHADRAVDRGFLDHLIPSFQDVPVMEVGFVELPHPGGHIGAKGLGEAPVLAIAPAVANAVSDATGARVRRLPITSERVLDALEQLHRTRKEDNVGVPTR